MFRNRNQKVDLYTMYLIPIFEKRIRSSEGPSDTEIAHKIVCRFYEF